MKPSLIDLLRDPASGQPLTLERLQCDGDEIMTGVLRGARNWYPIIDGVPRLLLGELRDDYSTFTREHELDRGSEDVATATLRSPARAAQAATTMTFSDKWTRFQQYGFEPSHKAFLNRWYAKKLGLASPDDLPAFHAPRRRILEIGPGSGFNTCFMAEHTDGLVLAVDVSEGAVTTYRNTRSIPNCHVVQADLMDLPCPDDHFDFAIADGVLHHTPDTPAAVEAVYRKVAPGGQFFFYVYRRMGAARFFCDQHLRERFSGLDPEACYDACKGITELGRELARLGARVTLEKGIPALGIPPGEHDVQRLLYYNFLKCFWNDAFDWDTNNMVNFDWYHPHHAWQHTDEEVEAWLRDLGVTEYRFNDANPNGISVLLTKPR